VGANGKAQTINLLVHHDGSEENLDKYTKKVKAVVAGKTKVYGEFPAFYYGKDSFIACYVPYVNRDGIS